MPARRLRRFVLLVVLAVLVARVITALRGDPAPAFARHPSVDGGPRPAPRPSDTGDTGETMANTGTGATETEQPSAGATDPDDDDRPTTARHLGPAPSSPVTPAPLRRTGPYPLTNPDHVWVEPVDGGCPDGFPVKAKLRSGIYHLPGMAAYERTVPDRCYPTADTAAADGLRPAKR